MYVCIAYVTLECICMTIGAENDNWNSRLWSYGLSSFQGRDTKFLTRQERQRANLRGRERQGSSESEERDKDKKTSSSSSKTFRKPRK